MSNLAELRELLNYATAWRKGDPTDCEKWSRLTELTTPAELLKLLDLIPSAATCPGHGRSECVSCCWPKGEEPAPVQTCQIGIYGRAYDGPGVTRAYTYQHQPHNVGASKLGQACYHAIQKPGGDSIDLGLGLLKHLQDAGFGVFEVKS